MKKLCNLLIFLVMFISIVNGQVVNLKELSRPDNILVDDKDIVITDGINIFIYSQKDYKLRNKLGKPGEGPQEFSASPSPYIPSIRVYLLPDQIFVSSILKVLSFDREGNFISEFRPIVPMSQYIPLGEKYVAVWLANDPKDKVQYITYTLHDKDKKPVKELMRIKSLDQAGKKIDPIAIGAIKNFLYRHISGNKIFIPDGDYAIHVFNEEGDKIAFIKPDYKKVSVQARDIDKFKHFYANDIRFKDIYEQDKNRIEYPSYYPLMKDYKVTREKVYVISNNKVKDKYETFIFDHHGKLLEKTMISLADADPLELYPFNFFNDQIYQLIEAEDNESWQLHIKTIK